ncbi:cysteine desulfurase family protein [Vallitaleaceae bacterium 9-2]
MNLYFDHAATTPLCNEALKAMQRMLQIDYGNPSSLHAKGLDAENEVNKARNYIAKLLGVKEKAIYFTSGGTESNNLCIQGVARAYHRSGKHIITSKIEHASVGETFTFLENQGFEVTRLPVDHTGQVSLDVLRRAIRPDTTMVSIMHVNNELGTIQDIQSIGKIIKEVNPNTLFHVDGVQGFGKFNLQLKQCQVDMYSASGHKIYGPKGVGFAYIDENIKIIPLQYGGSQQKGVRPGTENVAGIVGMYEAAKQMMLTNEERYSRLIELKAYFVERLVEELPDWYVNSRYSTGVFDKEIASPYIVNIRSKSIKGEVLLHSLEDDKIAVSTGSACSSKKLNVSHVLKAIGLSDEESDKSIRISFTHSQSKEDVDCLIDALKKNDKIFGRFVKK